DSEKDLCIFGEIRGFLKKSWTKGCFRLHLSSRTENLRDNFFMPGIHQTDSFTNIKDNVVSKLGCENSSSFSRIQKWMGHFEKFRAR
ncbi:hypothetical protein QYM36_000600, partial [Artemia franciscana]